MLDATGDLQQSIYDQVTPGLPGAAGDLLTNTSIVDPVRPNDTANRLFITTSSHKDAAGRTLVQTDGEGFTTLAYDANSNRVSYRDANGVGEDCVYDNADRDVSCTDTQGDVTSRSYDAANNVITSVDGLGKVEVCYFDSRGRKVECVDRIGAQTL